jgi:hypothetical protein
MTRKLDYRWNLRQVMASRGMFQTTDPAVVQPGLPAGHRAARAAEPEGADGAAGHPGVHDGRPDRAGRRREARPHGEDRERRGSRRREPEAPKSPDHERRQLNVTDPDVLADPVGTAVALITGTDPGLSREAAERAVTGVARGRAVRRRLAEALAGRPGILADGRSPAPLVAGDLLLALRKAGATVISSPVCAGCGRHLRTLSRLGHYWYCGGCARRDGRCSACGRETLIKSRDREGSVAGQWQRASAGDWTAYAADVSRRTRALSPAE